MVNRIRKLEECQRIIKKRLSKLEQDVDDLINDKTVEKRKKTAAELLQEQINAWKVFAEELNQEIKDLK